MRLNSFTPNLIKNRAKAAYSYLRRLPHNRGMPIEVVIEPTNHCNMKCPMCPRFQDKTMSTRGLGFMELSLFSKIINEIKDYAETVDLYLAGEPLLHPNIIEMINLCGKYGLKTVLHTNASFLDEQKGREIINSPLSVLDISFDGASKETYEQLRVGGNYDETLQNIERFLEMKKEKKGTSPYVIIHMIHMNKNKHEINLFLKKWKRKGVDEVRIKAFNKTGLSGENRLLGTGKGVSNNECVNKPCFLLWRFLVIHWDGTVVPCCLDFVGKEPLGNIADEKLEALWNGAKMKRLRGIHAEGKSGSIPLCKDCSQPAISTILLLGSIFVSNTTIKKRLLPIFERLWVLRKFKLFQYFNNA